MRTEEEVALADLLKWLAEIPESAWEKIEVISGNPRLGMSTAKLVLNDKEGESPKPKHTCPVCGNPVDEPITGDDLEDAAADAFFSDKEG